MSRRILVVEDQEDNRQIVRDLLTANDYEMTEAENGQEALAAVAKDRPDLILMDIQLPVMDGYEATRRIKADPSLSSIPVIAVTSYALSGDEEKARAAGCNDFVPKPYSPRQLLAKIRQYLPYLLAPMRGYALADLGSFLGFLANSFMRRDVRSR